MQRSRESSVCLDSPSKHSYIGSFHRPPDMIPRELCVAVRPPQGELLTSRETSGTTPDSGSRVMAALKTLQEKMRRLELERVQAERNVTRFPKVSQRHVSPTCPGGRSEVQPARETSPRKELVSQLRTTEARCSLLEKQLDYMRQMVKSVETERITSVSTEQGERTHSHPHIQLQKLERLEEECVKLTSTQSAAERKIELLEQKLLEEAHKRQLVQEKAEELQRELESNLLILSAAEVKPKTKKRGQACKKPLRTEVPVSLGLPKSKRMPFVAGTSTSPSHSVGGAVQSVLHLLKTRQPRLCERPPSTRRAPVRTPTPLSPGAPPGTLGSLSELLLALQDELGHQSFEHQDLLRQIEETDEPQLRENLERELDTLVCRMEGKAAQISKLRKHQQTVQKLSLNSPRQKQTPRRTAGVDGRGVSSVRASPTSPAKAPPSCPAKAPPSGARRPRSASQGRTQLRRDTSRLRSSLRQQDITWET
ncbi:centrosomal protein CEP57L1 isoform X2 [Brachyhypopomus gauderio]|uniref:centrosomal protein CEP57L1 isoform X2 n=1 Tax=Brachyhypopomus gauderio TaxID=698409 RepID=UPI0040412476